MIQKGDYIIFEYSTGEQFPGVVEDINGEKVAVLINTNLKKSENSELELVVGNISQVKPYIPQFS